MPFLIFENAGGRKKGVEIDSATVLGREAGCDLHIPNPLLSRRHCRFMHTKQGWIVEDLKSSGGTFIEGQRITQHVLMGGEIVKAGDIKITYLAQAPAGARKHSASSAAASRSSNSQTLEDQVLDVLTINRDDDDEEERSALMDAELAAIRQELAGESTGVLDESDTDTGIAEELSANATPAPAAAVSASASPAQPLVRQETSHMRGANLWDMATTPVPIPPKSKAKKSAAGVAKSAPGRGATSAELRGAGSETGGFKVRWDKKTIITLVVVSLVVVAVALELTGNLPFDLFH